ncbi:MAG: GspH/FimT family pseudopilin [Nitrospirae bacterium]|nr:GspH/FimT family pseudopilin [Nitrospirota bacterium]
MEKTLKKSSGVTLIELLVVMGITAVLLGLAVGPFMDSRKESRVRADVDKLLADLEWARSEAVRQGGMEMTRDAAAADKHRLYSRRVFAVFDLKGCYRVFRWVDANGDKFPAPDEMAMILPKHKDGYGKVSCEDDMKNSGGFWVHLDNSTFSWIEDVADGRRACSADNAMMPVQSPLNIQSAAKYFADARTPYLSFDSNGFSNVMAGTIYVSNATFQDGKSEGGTHSYAISVSPAGLFRMCKWLSGCSDPKYSNREECEDNGKAWDEKERHRWVMTR